MSYPSRILTSSEKTSNLPIVLASLVSAGLHGLLWIIQPALSTSSGSGVGQTVGIVQLTPEEMSRLPEYSLPKPTLPALPPPLPENTLPPLPPPLPPPVQSSTLLPPIPDVPVNPTIVDRTPSPSLSPSPTPESAPIRRRSSRTLEVTPKDRSTRQPDLNAQPSPTPQNPIEPLPSRTTESATTPKPPTTQERQDIARGTDPSGPPKDTVPGFPPGTVSPPVPPSTTANSTTQSRESVNSTNLQSHLPSLYSRSATAPAPSPPPSKEFTDSLVKYRHNYNPVGTTEQEGTRKFDRWLNDRITQFRNIDNFKIRRPIPANIKSPVDERLPDVSEAGVVVLIEPDGKMIGEPELTLSTGYPRLDRAALEDVKKRSFPVTGRYEIYQYRFTIDQSDLPSSSRTPSNS